MLEDLKRGSLKYEIAGEFLADIKKKFGGEDKEIAKVVELRRIEQEGKTMEKFIQKFQRAARRSGYEERSLVEEFKREMNGTIWQRLMELGHQPSLIEQ